MGGQGCRQAERAKRLKHKPAVRRWHMGGAPISYPHRGLAYVAYICLACFLGFFDFQTDPISYFA